MDILFAKVPNQCRYIFLMGLSNTPQYNTLNVNLFFTNYRNIFLLKCSIYGTQLLIFQFDI